MEKRLEPKLRFKEFNAEWKELKFKEIFKVNQGLQIPISDRFIEKGDNRYFYITNEFLRKNSEKEYYIENPSSSVICNEADILMTRTGNTGKVVTGVSGAFHNNFFKMDFSKELFSKNYLYQLMISTPMQNKIMSLAGTSTIPDLNHGDFYSIKTNIPPLPEQEKIASFLSSVDSKIEKLEKKRELLSQYKKGIMQKIFSQEIRFKDEEGKEYPEWEGKKLGDYLKVSNLKNSENFYKKTDVLSVSGQFGIVNQIEFQGRSFAGKFVDNYSVVENNDVVYTKSPLKSNPYGIIKVNKGKPGIVSTLYAVYKCTKLAYGEYIDYYFQLDDNTNRYLRPLVQKGAKNDMKISNSKVLIDPVYFPSYKEQKKIANFLSFIDKKIELVEWEIDKNKEFKKGLLQQMFV